ncbi:MAG: tRNA pseudouridine(55) synthase TruB [Chloroflexi bacterium RBG_16_56_11]|nr:MAG: tRNA pseudouridine(55) synthase TruB [Chloroflexi bacterium RBG_16_56_11]
MDGILNINKPAGMTSYGVVARVKRWSGERRVGHAGTLDPDATGVLPVCLGQGTKVVEFMVDAAKTYRAMIELGVTTDTYDSSGKVTGKSDPSCVSRQMVEIVLGSFRGAIRQTPPMYSALKHQGRPLYELARAGINVERQSRLVHIYRLEIIDWQPPVFTIEVECGRGTYIRSLAHDLGEALGCGASLAGLVRAKYGPFKIEEAVTLPRLEESFRSGDWQKYIYPIDNVLQGYDAVTLDEAAEKSMRNGSVIDLKSETDKKYLRVYSVDGRFLGVLQRVPDKDVWQPKKVLG